MTTSAARPKALAKIGRAILRLRLYYGWSQADLGRSADLSQGTISRLERGVQRGMSIRRLAAVMEALHVAEVTFDRPPTVPQTDLEIMLFGDRWKRAVQAVDRRLRWPVPQVEPAAQNDVVAESVVADDEPTAWFGGGGYDIDAQPVRNPARNPPA